MDLFRRQMEFLRAKGYRVLSLEEFERCMRTGRFPERSVLITIDDGYKSTMKAFEVLKEFDYPFVLFLYMEAVARYPDFLTKEQLMEMKRWGKVAFGLHSWSHYRLTSLAGSPEDRIRDFFLRDLERAQRRFERLLGERPRVFAYPYGEYSPELVEVLKKEGYTLAFSQDVGVVGPCTNPYAVPRLPVVGSWSSFWRFRMYLSLRHLCYRVQAPGYGFVKSPFEVKAEVVGNYRRCLFYATDLGWFPLKRPFKARLWLRLPFGRKRLGFKCWDDRGRIHEGFWLVIPEG